MATPGLTKCEILDTEKNIYLYSWSWKRALSSGAKNYVTRSFLHEYNVPSSNNMPSVPISKGCFRILNAEVVALSIQSKTSQGSHYLFLIFMQMFPLGNLFAGGMQ